jgi:hypothetical protein
MKIMRVITLLSLLVLVIPTVDAQIAPQTLGPSEKMPPIGENWFISVTRDGGYILDATNGEMYGMLRASGFTPAIQPSADRSEFYAAASYYSRGSYGERADILFVRITKTCRPSPRSRYRRRSRHCPIAATSG